MKTPPTAALRLKIEPTGREFAQVFYAGAYRLASMDEFFFSPQSGIMQSIVIFLQSFMI